MFNQEPGYMRIIYQQKAFGTRVKLIPFTSPKPALQITGYFEGSESISKVGESSLLLPKNVEKGLVRSYFVTPGNLQLDVMRLFKRP